MMKMGLLGGCLGLFNGFLLNSLTGESVSI